MIDRTRLRSLFECPQLPLHAGMVCLGMSMMLWFGGTPALAQSRFTDVLVSVVKNKVVAVNEVGPSEIDIGVGETVMSTKAFGLTGLAITSTRLPLQGDELQSIENTGDAVLVKTSRRTLMFRSRMSGWTEMR